MMFTRVLAVALAALVVSATPATTTTTTTTTKRSFNPLDIVLNPLTHFAPLPAPAPAKRLTNAQRMARGLSPYKPNFAARRAPMARRSSTPCVPNTGVIAVTFENTDGSTRNTYLGAPNAFGEFGPDDDVGSALQVSFCAASSPEAGITTVSGGIPAFPFLAFIQGYANTSPDLASGSPNYAYLASSTETPPGSAPVNQANSFSAAAGVAESVETDIWNIDLSSGAITPSWINSNNDPATVFLVYIPSSNAFAITGDVQAFAANYGDASPATFSYVAQ